MLTSIECLAKADEMETLAARCLDEGARFAYAQAAEEWRRIAILARQQEAWSALNPE